MRISVAALLALAVVVVVAGCYDPAVANGGLVCAAGGECPTNYYCAADHRCWQRGTGPAHEGAHDLGGTRGGDLAGGGTIDLGGDLGGDLAGGGGTGGSGGGPDLALRPAAPSGLTTVPGSPAHELHPYVKGSAPAGTTVRVYANGTCSGTPAAQGSAADFAAGLSVTVGANSTTTLSATASLGSAVSDCSPSIDYVCDTIAPARPTLTGTSPPSPSPSALMPYVIGTAEAGSTVTLFTDAACAGPGIAATGSAAALANPGLQVTVASGSTTTFYANAVDAAGNVSPCSTGLTYTEDPSTPAAPSNVTLVPAGPSTNRTPTMHGTAPSGTVDVYATSDCSGAKIASGTSATFGGAGLPVSAAVNMVDSFSVTVTAGNGKTSACTSGIQYVEDETAPAGGVVADGSTAGTDLVYQKSLTSLGANWSGFSDALSGISSYDWNVSSSTACGGDVYAVHAVGNVTTASASMTLTAGNTYYACVRAYDGAGNPSGWAHSNGVTIDDTPPTGGTVRDGVASDVQFQSSLAAMASNWVGFADAGSGLAGYNYALSTHADCSLPVVMQTIPSTTGTGTIGVNVTLSDGVKYYNCVQAFDALGNTQAAFSVSDGVTIDHDKPTGGSVHDGTAGDLAWLDAASQSSMGVNWSGFGDGTGSGIVVYDWQLTTTSDCSGAAVAGMSGVGAGPGSYTANVLTLADATTYYNCIRADDAVGNQGPWVASNGITTDFTAPSSGSVIDGAGGPDALWLNDPRGASARWSGFADGGSGITRYDYNLSSTTGCLGDVYGGNNGVSGGSGSSFSFTNGSVLTQGAGTTYYNCVRAVDTAGNHGAWVASSGFHVDAVKPTLGTVRDGTSGDAAWWNSATQVTANWSGFSDADSGLAAYTWALSSKSDCSAIDAALPASGVSSPYTGSTSISLVEGASYYNCVQATDIAGNTSAWKPSSGVRIDVTPPSVAAVRDGLAAGVENAWSNSTTQDALNWDAFTDSGSGLASYDAILASDSGCTTPVGFAQSAMPAGTSNVTLMGSGLVNGTKYYNCVRARDQASNPSAYVASSGVTIDTVNPTAPTITGAVAGSGQVKVTWSTSSDPGGSGVADYGVSACSGTGCVVSFFGSTAGNNLTVTGLTDCQPATIQVVARDYAGNLSSPATVTASPTTPVPGPITVVPGAGRFEYSFPSVAANAQYAVCWGASSSPSTSGTCTFGTPNAAFVDGTDSGTDVPVNTAWLQVRALANGCYSGWSAAQPINLFGLSPVASGSSTQNNQWMGYQVANLGDLNKDGQADYAVAYNFGAPTTTSSVTAYSGKDGSALWTKSGFPHGPAIDYFGSVIGVGGDVDGDGANDVLIGAPADFSSSGSHANQGNWYLYSGATGAQLCTGGLGVDGGQRGASLAIIHDVTGDAIADFIVGSPGVLIPSVSPTSQGLVEVFSFDKSSSSCKLQATLNDPGTSTTDRFGSGVAGLSDYNSDGHDDFAISSPGAGTTGSVWIWSGSYDSVNNTYHYITTAVPNAGDRVGTLLAAVGDVDGDNRIDFISSYNGGSGWADVFSGANGAVLARLSGGAGDRFGFSIGPAGDINRDGYADYFVGAIGTTVNGVAGAGSLYVYSGKTAKVIYEIDGTTTNANVGWAAAGGFDVSGDGNPDLVVGQYTASSTCGAGNSNCGEWWVYGPNNELGLKPAEWINPLYGSGYAGAPTPIAAPLTLQASGGSGGYTYIYPGPKSGGSLVGANYAPGATQDVLDTVAVRDSAHRELETRLWVRSMPAAAKPIIERALNLRVTATGSGTVTLAWGIPAGNPAGAAPLFAYRQPTGAWSVTPLAAGTSTYKFTGAPGTSYRFRVKETSSVGDSLWSNEVVGATGP